MAKMGNVRHLKSLNAPLFFGGGRKSLVYVTKPDPGRHTLDSSISLLTLLKRLSIASKSADAKRIINGGLILVNGKKIKERNYPVGFNDTIEVANENRYYRIRINNKGQMITEEAKKPDYDSMIFKVTGKYKVKDNQIMLKLQDGKSVKGKADAKVNDSVIIDSKDVVSKVLKLDMGAQCTVLGGVHAGASGKISSIIEGTLHRRQSVMVQQKDGKEFETLVRNVMVTE